MLNYASKLDNDLERHLETSKSFLRVVYTINKDILGCALEVYRKEVVSLVEKATFYSSNS